MRLFPKDRDLAQAPDRVELVVDASDMRLRVEEVHVRLDQFLAGRLKWRSRTSVQRLIKDGYLLVDAASPEHPHGSGQFEVERRPGRKLRHGSRVTLVIPEEYRLEVRVGDGGDLRVLYEDEHLVAVDKPPMQAVHPAGRHLTGTLIQQVHARYGGAELPRGARPRLCHRLDRETSGIVLVGKDPDAHARVMGMFEHREVEKVYLAIVHGEPDRDEGVIDLPIGPARASRIGLRMAVREDGLSSRTDWRVLERRAGFALVRCRLHTGRQHQIRVHLEAVGHPLVGDKLYGHDGRLFQRNLDGRLTREDEEALLLPRQALHHHHLAFVSPLTDERVEITSPLADDLREFLEQL